MIVVWKWVKDQLERSYSSNLEHWNLFSCFFTHCQAAVITSFLYKLFKGSVLTKDSTHKHAKMSISGDYWIWVGRKTSYRSLWTWFLKEHNKKCLNLRKTSIWNTGKTVWRSREATKEPNNRVAETGPYGQLARNQSHVARNFSNVPRYLESSRPKFHNAQKNSKNVKKIEWNVKLWNSGCSFRCRLISRR